MTRTIFCLILCVLPVISVNADTANTKADQSPAIVGDHSLVNYGIPPEQLIEIAKKVGATESERDSWMQKYRDLEKQLDSRTDDTLKQAKTLLNKGDLAQAETLFKQALQQGSKNAAEYAFFLAQIKVLQLDYPAVKTYYSQAVQLNPGNVLYLNALGEYLYTTGDYAAAEPLFVRSLEIDKKALGENSPDVATRLNNLAGLYYLQGKYAEAEPLLQRAIAIDEKTLGEEHPNVAGDLNNLAAFYEAQGKFTEAESLYKRSLAIDEKIYGKNHPDVATDLSNLAGLYQTQSKVTEAELLYQRSLAILEKTLGKNHSKVATCLNNLAFLYEKQGKVSEAEALYQRALAIMEKSLGTNHPNTKTLRENLEALQAAKK